MKRKGFTLIELVITITCVIILSAISVPIYKGYIWSAKRAEGYALLSSLRDAEFQYYGEYGNFFTTIQETRYNEVLGIDARGNKYFTSFRTNVDNTSGYNKKFHVNIFVYSVAYGTLSMRYNKTSGIQYS